jgi:hypothetical protein
MAEERSNQIVIDASFDVFGKLLEKGWVFLFASYSAYASITKRDALSSYPCANNPQLDNQIP